jgi:hypothetical protein
MNIKKDDLLIFVKILIFGYILASPFISHIYLTFINYTPIKIIFLIIIVLLSFIDLQLAVLTIIAFLLILVNLNKEDIKNMQKKADKEYTTSEELTHNIIDSIAKPINKEEMIRGKSILQIPSDILEIEKFQNPFSEMPNNPIKPNEKYEQTYRYNYNDETQTISKFPKPYCNIVEYDPILISQGLSDYSLDYRTKPYEEYIRHLSPNKSIDNIQTNMVN